MNATVRLYGLALASFALVAGIAAIDPTGEAIASERHQVDVKLAAALTDLRQTLGKGGQALYQLPWYAIIGPPGAGKTTALFNSGLRFPLAERHGAEPVRGVGGTRNCDWWFTEKAVLLDTVIKETDFKGCNLKRARIRLKEDAR